MKKLLCLFFLTTLTINVFSLATYDNPNDETYYPYKGPRDEATKDYSTYWSMRNDSTLGQLAKYSDIIAIGHVVTQDWTKVVIQADVSLVGCTNNQIIAINRWAIDHPETAHDWFKQSDIDINNPPILPFPTYNSHIIFSVYSNKFDEQGFVWINWNNDAITNERTRASTTYRFLHEERSYWLTEREDGLLLNQFTNVVQKVRIDRDWTNFYYLCRDGMNLPSNRIKEDSYYDMRGFIRFATTNQAQFIYNDPLAYPGLNNYLLERHPYLLENQE